MQTETEQLAEKIAALEAALEVERNDRGRLSTAIQNEALERQEALLWQEHRLISAARSLYQLRNNPDLRWAAAGGLLSAFVGRSTATAIAGGGLLALMVTAALTLQSNYLLSLQTERMDLQTIVMDAQRRTQNFQAEFSVISTDVAGQLLPQRERLASAVKKFREAFQQSSMDLADVIDKSRTGNNDALDQSLQELSSDLRKPGGGFHSVSYNVLRSFSDSIKSLPSQLPDQLGDKLSSYRKQLDTIWREYREALGDKILDHRDSAIFRENEVFYQLEVSTRLRIAGLSLSARPSPIVDFETRPRSNAVPGVWGSMVKYFSDPSFGAQASLVRLSDKKTSPERGQLLTFLVAQHVWLPSIFESGADFSGSDLSARTLGPLYFGSAKFEEASFVGTEFHEIFFSGNFKNADFRCAHFSGGKIGTGFTNARFAGASFGNNVSIHFLFFVEADLDEANLYDANLVVPPGSLESIPKLQVEGIAPLGEVLAELQPQRKDDLINRYQKFLVQKVGDQWKIKKRNVYSETPFCRSLGLPPRVTSGTF